MKPNRKKSGPKLVHCVECKTRGECKYPEYRDSRRYRMTQGCVQVQRGQE